MKTPIGTVNAVYTFADSEASIVGSAASSSETVELSDIRVEGDAVTWRQSVTKPMRLNLEFEVTVSGDELEGFSRAGRLPRSRVSGVRRAA